MTASLRSRVSIAAGLALLLSACAATSPQADARFGQSVRAAVSAQVANPAAARNPDPVAGIDGRSARAAQERYERASAKDEGGAAATSVMVGTR